MVAEVLKRPMENKRNKKHFNRESVLCGQFWVEVTHFSAMCFNRVTAFEVQ